MGVKGLTSYVRDNGGDLTLPHSLHNCDLVIDGNNLLYFLYYRTDIEWRFGGEYDFYANSVRRFFSTLQDCLVTSHVIFDGCYSSDGTKFKTVMSRARDRMDTLRRLNKGLHCGRLLPPLAPQVMVAVLDELGVDHLTCADEADVNIAALASQLSCPVLSNDSDFFVFDLTGGVVHLDSVSPSPCRYSCECCDADAVALPCSLYLASRLARWGMEVPFLPLLATLLGNDFVPQRDLDAIFSRVKLPKPSRRAGKRHGRTDSLLQWLKRFEEPETALHRLLSHVVEEKREGVRERLEHCLKQYRVDDAWIHARHPPDHLCALPTAWEAFQRHRLAPGLVNAAACGFVFLLPGPERISLPSAHAATADVRLEVYAALRLAQPVLEYGRRDGNVCKQKSDEPGAAREFRDLSEAVETLMRRSGVRKGLDDDLSHIVMLMAFWANRCGVSKLHITALLLSIVSRLVLSRELPQSLQDGEQGRKRIVDVLAKYLSSPPVNHAKPLDLVATHAFFSFQVCLFTFVQLSWTGTVTDSTTAESLADVHKFLVGRLYYNLLTDLKRRSGSSMFIQELLGRQSRLNSWFWKTMEFLLECVPSKTDD